MDEQSKKNDRWVKYRFVKRAVEQHMTCVDVNEDPHEPTASDKRCKLNTRNDHAPVSDLPCNSDSSSSEHGTGMCNSSSITEPNVTADDMAEGLLESYEYSSSDSELSDYSRTVEHNLDLNGETTSLNSFCDDTDIDTTDNENECQKALPLGEELANWASKHNTSQVAVSDLLKILVKYHPSLPKDARTLKKTTSVQSIQPMNDALNRPGEYVYFGIEKQLLENMFNTVTEYSLGHLQLLFNVDGLPLYRSSSKQFWPILCAAYIDGIITKPFVVAVFCGNSKPLSADVFFSDFVRELSHLQQSGVCFGESVVSISVKGFICDAPARAFIKCIKGHSGYYGCEKCEDRGKQVNKKMTFQNLDATLRSDESFLHQRQEEHHRGVSPLINLNVGLVTCVPLEYMHLICLGVMKKLLMAHWLRGELNVRISMQMASLISEQLLELKPYICSEFNRKPRGLTDIDRWKAVEFRLFLCYIGPVVLRGSLLSELYHHFMLLHVAVFMLLDPLNAHDRCEDANELLRKFVSQMRELYGADSVVYTIHSLIHVADDVKVFGALDSYSAFGFENHLGKLKRLLRSGNAPLRQLCRRLTEQSAACKRTDRSSSRPVLSDIHCDGPTCGIYGVQYNKMHYEGYVFSSKGTADCYVLLQCGKVVKIVNIIDAESLSLIGYVFEEKSSFYSYPCDSQLLNVCKFNRLSKEAIVFCHTDIVRKCLILPRRRYFICYPLLHVGHVSAKDL